MNLYLISQDKNVNYDTYDSAVVAAEDEAAARATHPSLYEKQWPEPGHGTDGTWVSIPEKVIVCLIGVAADGIEPGVICSSYNAG